jgi:hypothetical protein
MSHLDPALLTQLITAIIGALGALGALFVALAGYFKSKSNASSIAATNAKVDDNTKLTAATSARVEQNTKAQEATHEAINSKMDALLKVTRDSSFAAGQKDQADKQTAANAAKETKDEFS